MAEDNQGVFVGTVEAPPEIRFLESGKCKADLKLKRTETWQTGSRDVFVVFKFFGQPAEGLAEKNLKVGQRVKVTFQLGSWEGKDKVTKEPTGQHYPELKGWKVEVAKTDPNDISFYCSSLTGP